MEGGRKGGKEGKEPPGEGKEARARGTMRAKGKRLGERVRQVSDDGAEGQEGTVIRESKQL